MKTLSTLLLLSSLTFGCASTRLGGSGEPAIPQRGDMLVQRSAAKAVVAAPVWIHAYSAFSGGTLFVADAVTGTDRDCQIASHVGVGEPLLADRVQSVGVGVGKVVCLATSGNRGVEMLWHAKEDASLPVFVAHNQQPGGFL